MSEEKYKNIIAEIESLPQGGITYKKINGKEYAYYQWREEGKQRSRRAKDDELENLLVQIERRKELEAVLKEAGTPYKTAKAAKPRKTAQTKTASKAKAKSAPKTESEADTKVESRWLADETRRAVRTALCRPGESDSQAEALTRFLLEDEFFSSLSQAQRETATKALTARVKAIMLEDMLHLETKAARTECEVFRLHMENGTFQMVIANPKEGSCELYEIKHCKELSRAHAAHLLDDETCSAVARRYGQITGRFVIYKGKTINVMESGTAGGLESVKYWNVDKYLEGLKS